jgi:parallel beta-helix repeat protein
VRCGCGDVLSESYSLPADLGPCAGDGLVLRGTVRLDCDGHTLRGSADSADAATRSATVGIVLDRTEGAVVSNCAVTGFRSGIEFREARGSTIQDSTVFRNGNLRTRVGYGIHLSRAQRNTVRDCTVHSNADEGIHVGTGSDGNRLVANNAYDNGRENLYILSARGTQLTRNRIGGKVSAALYMKHASASRIEGNRFDSRPVVVRGRSTGNVFADNVFTAGLSFQAYSDGRDATDQPTGNVVRGGRLAGARACLTFTDASDNRIEAADLTGCQRIVAHSGSPSMNHFVDVSLERVPLDIGGGASLRLLRRVRVEVLSADGRPVPGARFDLRDRMGQTSDGPRTDDAGSVEVLVPMHVVSPASLVALSPVHLRLRSEGYVPLETVLTEPLPARLTLHLEPIR